MDTLDLLSALMAAVIGLGLYALGLTWAVAVLCGRVRQLQARSDRLGKGLDETMGLLNELTGDADPDGPLLAEADIADPEDGHPY